MTYLRFSTGGSLVLVNTVLSDTEQTGNGAQAFSSITVFPQKFPHHFFGLRWFLFIVMALKKSLLHRSYY